MDKSRKPKPPKGPKGPKSPQKFSDKTFLKQFSMDVKSYKAIKQEETPDGLMLKAMPVFKAGTHRGFEYTTKWLDKFLIGQFDESEDVPIQRDHSDEAYATLGYVKKLYRDGDMVFADMLLIDETAISRWKKGLMKKWSVGISREFKLAEISAVAFPYIKEARVHSDTSVSVPTLVCTVSPSQENKFTWTVTSTSDLGESETFTSAINSITESFTKENTTSQTFNGSATITISNADGVFTIKDGDNMDEQLKKDNEALQAQLSEVSEKLKTVETQLSEKDKEIEVYKKAKADAEFAQLKASVEAEVKALIKDGKVAPAREKSLVDVMANMSEEARKEMIQTFKESGKIGELTETGTVVVKKETSEFKDGEGKFEFGGKIYDIEAMSAEEVNDLADAYAAKNDLGFAEALDIIYDKSSKK